MNPTPGKQADYWFPAKRQGWGWGLPSNRKGWTVLAMFYALVAGGALHFLPRHQIGEFIFFCVVLCGLLILVCYVTGEPPRWRGGSNQDS